MMIGTITAGLHRHFAYIVPQDQSQYMVGMVGA